MMNYSENNHDMHACLGNGRGYFHPLGCRAAALRLTPNCPELSAPHESGELLSRLANVSLKTLNISIEILDRVFESWRDVDSPILRLFNLEFVHLRYFYVYLSK